MAPPVHAEMLVVGSLLMLVFFYDGGLQPQNCLDSEFGHFVVEAYIVTAGDRPQTPS